jgi:putative flippase GtrA
MRPDFQYFLIAGGIAALVNIGARYAFNQVTSFEIAVVLAFPFGLLTAYFLCRRLVFTPSGRSRYSELSRFLAVNLVALILVWVISVGLARVVFPSINFTWHADDIAHVIGVFAPAIASFFGHKYYSFRQKMV